GGGGRGRRDGDGAERSEGSPPPARLESPKKSPPAAVVEPRPIIPALPPGVPAGAKPKSLYGGARRRLAPSEMGRIKARKD
ncbi:MAG: hypothetical protein KDA05_03915, partial [Phycisphaerales bacterium]|nr:hypothetical protein [Phycisphaerales bacterium]